MTVKDYESWKPKRNIYNPAFAKRCSCKLTRAYRLFEKKACNGEILIVTQYSNIAMATV